MLLPFTLRGSARPKIQSIHQFKNKMRPHKGARLYGEKEGQGNGQCFSQTPFNLTVAASVIFLCIYARYIEAYNSDRDRDKAERRVDNTGNRIACYVINQP